MDIATFGVVGNKIVTINQNQVLIDLDVADLYGVETKRINEAVKNNPDRFPDGYVLVLTKADKDELVENFDRFKKLKHSTVMPKAFTEKGLYMLATILKSKVAIQTTIAIVETYSKIKQLSRTVKELSNIEGKGEQKALMQKSGQLIAEILDDDLAVTDSETSIELLLQSLKFKHTVKKKKS